MTEPTGNATRFATAGTQIKMRIILNDGNNGTTAATYLTTTSYVTVKAIGTTAASATAIRGTSSADAKNFVLLYDNTSGTGRPIAGTVHRQFICKLLCHQRQRSERRMGNPHSQHPSERGAPN
ncbi:MAG: hypothetical protein EBZ07_07720 [Verrucomicrobia bacterium]|nr:hypothetical protein [Verrucomicrobiota bacterium]